MCMKHQNVTRPWPNEVYGVASDIKVRKERLSLCAPSLLSGSALLSPCPLSSLPSCAHRSEIDRDHRLQARGKRAKKPLGQKTRAKSFLATWRFSRWTKKPLGQKTPGPKNPCDETAPLSESHKSEANNMFRT